MKNCKHCGGDLAIRMPKGSRCDHLKYPEFCQVCNRSRLTVKTLFTIIEDHFLTEKHSNLFRGWMVVTEIRDLMDCFKAGLSLQDFRNKRAADEIPTYQPAALRPVGEAKEGESK